MTLIERIRDRLDTRDVLLRHGVAIRGFRCRCPIHAGSNPQAFVVSRDGERWRCYACGRAGDAIDLVAELSGLDRRTAIRRAAELAGLSKTAGRGRDRASDERRRAVLVQERLEEDALFRRRWTRLVRALHHSRGEQTAVRLVSQTDPDEQDARTRRALDAIGDPHLREELLMQAVDHLEREWRTWRAEHGDPLAGRRAAIEAMWARWREENAREAAER